MSTLQKWDAGSAERVECLVHTISAYRLTGYSQSKVEVRPGSSRGERARGFPQPYSFMIQWSNTVLLTPRLHLTSVYLGK